MAVEFDMIPQNCSFGALSHKYIAVVKNGYLNHNTGNTMSFTGSSQNLTFMDDGFVHNVYIRYNGTNKTISVAIDNVTYLTDIDTTSASSLDRSRAYLGFTAGSGRPTEILSWKMKFGTPSATPQMCQFQREDTIGLYNRANASFLLRNSNTAGSYDIGFPFGPSGDQNIVPLMGD